MVLVDDGLCSLSFSVFILPRVELAVRVDDLCWASVFGRGPASVIRMPNLSQKPRWGFP